MDFTHDGDTYNRGSGSWGGQYMWVFALVLLALFFIWGKDGRHGGGYDNVYPALAAANCAKQGISHEIWDVERDQMREFANLRQEIVQTGWTQTRDNDRYHYETRAAIDRNNFDAAIGFKNSEILGLQSKSEIMARIDVLERTFKEDEIRKQAEKITQLETIIGVRGLGLVPAYNPSYNVPCNPCHGYSGGYA